MTQLQFFASCAGRLSAQMEFSWLLQDMETADRAEAHRATLVDLVEALRTEADGPQVLSWRINAKMAHAALLSRAHFNDDPEDARWARQMALEAAGMCTANLLS